MLARTHGQVATPTRLGKEILVFADRIYQQYEIMKKINKKLFTAKFGGATGGLNAHVIAFKEINWIEFVNNFISNLGLEREQWTTQISHYDSIATLCDWIKRINIILLNFCKDIWLYISLDYFKQKIELNEVGSSAMPHKVNPIDFENAEGNLGIANSLLEHLSSKLPISRMQRDLTDSTVLRNLGVPMGHSILAYNSIQRGLNKLLVNKEKINLDLEENWIIISEAIQTILRRENYPQPYEELKKLTRTNQKITQHDINNFIESLNISENIKNELKSITPFNYIGIVPDITLTIPHFFQ